MGGQKRGLESDGSISVQLLQSPEDLFVFPGDSVTRHIISYTKSLYEGTETSSSPIFTKRSRSSSKNTNMTRERLENSQGDEEEVKEEEDLRTFLRSYNLQLGSGLYERNEREVISSKAGKLKFYFDYGPASTTSTSTQGIVTGASSSSSSSSSVFSPKSSSMASKLMSPTIVNASEVGRAAGTRGGSLEEGKRTMKKFRQRLFCFVECIEKRYAPKEGDIVHGIILSKGGDRNGEYYRVNIFGNSEAILPVLAFEGATKRSRPQLVPKSLVLCRVESLHNKELDIEVSCIVPEQLVQSPLGKAMQLNRKSWLSGEYALGELKDDRLFTNIHLHLARRLLGVLSEPFMPSIKGPEQKGQKQKLKQEQVSVTIFDLLKKKDPGIEIYVGANGTLSIQASNKLLGISALNAILNYEYIHEEEMESMIHQVFSFY